MIKKVLLALTAIALLASCTTYNSLKSSYDLSLDSDIATVQQMTANQLYGVSDNNLCYAYYHNKPPLVKAEIKRRNLISNDHWQDVEKQHVVKGMSMCAVLAAVGKPAKTITSADVIEMDYSNGLHLIMMKKENDRYYAINVNTIVGH